MKKILLPITILLLTLSFSCKKEQKTVEVAPEPKTPEQRFDESYLQNKAKFTINLEPKSGSNVSGTVTIIEDKYDYVKMIARLSGLTPGMHAIHIHETADCSSADGKSTGGHWNPTGQPHGAWKSKKGYHKGDIGNFIADEQGEGLVTMHTNDWCVTCDDKTKNIVGKAIIVHQGVDDLVSQPSGAAGKRISCAGIIQ